MARRRNALALKLNRKKNSRRGRRRNSVALRLKNRRGRRRNPTVRILNRKRNRRGGRRRNPVALRTNRKRGRGRRRNGLAVTTNPRRRNRKANRRHGRKRNRMLFGRKNRASTRKNRGRGRRRNPTFIVNRRGRGRRRNSGGGVSSGAMFAPVSRILAKIPVVGKYMGFVGPALLGAGALGLTFVVMSYGAQFIPEMAAPYVLPIGYTLGGAALGLAITKLPIPVSSSTKAALGLAMVVGGGAVDMFRYLSSSGMIGEAMGDGGLWQLGSDDDPGEPDDAIVQSEYSDAQASDALLCGSDLSGDEGNAALAGSGMWRRVFPQVRSASRVRGYYSKHAQKHGGRWGWLIKAIGFKRFKALCALPAQERTAYISQLRAHAIASLPAGAQIAAQAEAAQSAQMAGLGSLVYAG